MTASIIGISSGFLVIFLFVILKQFDKKQIYGLILTGIGFLYVGFVWTNLQDLVINSIQALLFLLIAYYGVQRNVYLLAAGFFLHGCWDITYAFWRNPGLIPPHYDLFCLTIDFVMGIYILVFKKHFIIKRSIL
jgi:hypothetical protein